MRSWCAIFTKGINVEESSEVSLLRTIETSDVGNQDELSQQEHQPDGSDVVEGRTLSPSTIVPEKVGSIHENDFDNDSSTEKGGSTGNSSSSKTKWMHWANILRCESFASLGPWTL
jgi:hypothetical protein